METEKLEEIIETIDKKNPSPDYKSIGKHFKSISTIIGVYFVVNFILELIPKIYPKGFWNENIYSVSEDQINSIINNYSWLNLISSIFFFVMVFTTIISLTKIGNEFINFSKLIEKNDLMKSNEIIEGGQSSRLRNKREKNDFFDYLAIIVTILIIVGVIVLIVSSVISKK
jgi:hypothetical protein